MPQITPSRPTPRTDRAMPVEGPDGLPRVVPQHWHGQVDCAVGPFASRPTADRFARRSLDSGLFDVASRRIFALRGAWFVEVRPLTALG